MMFRNFVLALAALMAVSPSSVSSQGTGFSLLGQEIVSPFSPAALTEADASADDDFGTIVSLSANGKRMAVGAPGFDYSGPQDNDNRIDAGAVFVYELVYNPDTTDYMWDTLSLSLFGQESESIGRYLWLSPNGQRVAVRRGDGTVEVYSTDTATIIGSAVKDCLGGGVELTDQYLVTSCDRFDANRGKVQVYQLVSQAIDDASGGTIIIDNGNGDSGTWELVVAIEGDAAGDRFGWRTTLDESPGDDRLFRLAVSAPNHDDKTGLVRSYTINLNGDAQQFGQDLTGLELGEQFGFAIAMSRQSPNPFLVIGAPQAAAGGMLRGAIRIYNYSNNDEWAISAEFAGPEDRDNLGRDVAITANGDRAAASTFRSAQFAGLVTVYERTGPTNFEELSSDLFGQEALDRFGNNVALSETGSIIASGSIKRQNGAEESVGSVRVFVDQSSFCSTPTHVAVLDYPFGNLDLENFFERQTCRRGSTLATTEAACSVLSNIIGGQDVPCEWREPASDVSASVAPTPSPSSSPSRAITPGGQPGVPEVLWSLEVCPCDGTGNCIEKPLPKYSELGICIRGSRDDINLVSVETFRLEQGSNSVVIIDETGLESSLFAASASCTDDSCVIRTPVDAAFFGTGRPDSLVATGTVQVAFRRSRSLRGEARELQYDRGDFTVYVALSRGDDENSGDDSKQKSEENLGLPSSVWIVLVFLVALIIGCCCCITAKRQGEKNAGHLHGKSRKQVSEKEIDEYC